MQARYVILRVLQEIEGFVEIKECLGEDGQPDLLISLDKSKIKTVGKQAIGQFLCKLQVSLWKTVSTFIVLYSEGALHWLTSPVFRGGTTLAD